MVERIQELEREVERKDTALRELATSRRLLTHAKSCPVLFDGDCTCGAQHAADIIGAALRSTQSMKPPPEE